MPSGRLPALPRGRKKGKRKKRGRPASQAAPGGDNVHEVWLALHHLTEDPMRQAFPASAGGPFPRGSPRCHPWGVAFLEGWDLGRAWCRGTSTLQALGLSVSLPFRRAASTRLVPCLYGSQPPREGGLHERWSDCTHSCHDEAGFPCHRMCCGPDDPLWFALSACQDC